jgi:hypothetical protein
MVIHAYSRPRRTPAAALGVLAAWAQLSDTWPGARWRTLGNVAIRGAEYPLAHVFFPGGPRHALLVAGIHGDESSGVLALLTFFTSGDAASSAAQWTFDVLPLVNPVAFSAGRHGRPGCPDLEVTFVDPPGGPEARAILSNLVDGSTARTADDTARWDIVVSLHEDGGRCCLSMYDTGSYDRHDFVSAVTQTVSFLDWAEAQGMPVCAEHFVGGECNRDGLLVGGELPLRGLEPLLFRRGLARRVVAISAPGRLPEAVRRGLHLAALRRFLANCEDGAA